MLWQAACATYGIRSRTTRLQCYAHFLPLGLCNIVLEAEAVHCLCQEPTLLRLITSVCMYRQQQQQQSYLHRILHQAANAVELEHAALALCLAIKFTAEDQTHKAPGTQVNTWADTIGEPGRSKG
jgi:hypothetical protein